MDFKLLLEILILSAKIFFPKIDVETLEQVLGTITNEPYYQENQVTEIVDGDTFKIILNGKEETVRLVGIDTPETKHPQKGMECFGKEASQKLSDLIDKKTVILKNDTIQPEIDRYGRLLRYVTLQDGIEVNKVMIEEGYAKAYTTIESDKLTYYLYLESVAKEKNLGLWAKCE